MKQFHAFLIAVGLSLAPSAALGVVGMSSAGELNDLTCSLELIGASLLGVMEDKVFATEQEARGSTKDLPNVHGTWAPFSDTIYSEGSLRSVEPLNGRMVSVVVREKKAESAKPSFRRITGLFLSSLRAGGGYWPGQQDSKDSFVVLGRKTLYQIPGGDVVAIYKNNGLSIAIAPVMTGNPLIDAVPSRAFTPADSSQDGIQQALNAAQDSLQFLPHLGYKKLVFNHEDEPQTVDKFLVGKILAGVCQHPTGGTVIVAGKVTEATSRVTGLGWVGKPETYRTPTAWGVTVILDGSFGAGYALDFMWCKSLWIHNGESR